MEQEASPDQERESISSISRPTIVQILIILESGYVLQLVGALHVAFLFSFFYPLRPPKQAVFKTMVCLTIDDILESKKMALKLRVAAEGPPLSDSQEPL